LRGDDGRVVHEGVESETESVDEFLRRACDEIGEKIGLQAQPEPFDGIEVRAVAGQELAGEVVPVQPCRFVSGSVVEDEHVALSRLGRHGFGEFVEEALENISVHTVEDECKALPRLGADGAHHVGADVLAQVRHLRPAAPRAPAPPRTRVAFHATMRRRSDF
jgi:hypothetical protein